MKGSTLFTHVAFQQAFHLVERQIQQF